MEALDVLLSIADRLGYEKIGINQSQDRMQLQYDKLGVEINIVDTHVKLYFTIDFNLDASVPYSYYTLGKFYTSFFQADLTHPESIGRVESILEYYCHFGVMANSIISCIDERQLKIINKIESLESRLNKVESSMLI